MDLLIKNEVLKKAEITADELLIEIAVHLYDIDRLSMGQARILCNLDILSFRKESNRDIYIKYDIQDLRSDLENLDYVRYQKQASLNTNSD